MSEPDVIAGRLADWVRRRSDCRCEDGLSEVELERAEDRFAVTMPPLWRLVLRLAHPVSLPKPPSDPDGVLRWARFPDWRLRDEPGTEHLLDGPVEGLLFDVEHNGFWWHEWADPPQQMPARLEAAAERLATVPRLTPLWGHIYMGSDDASPVFSIVQADLYIPYLTLADVLTGASQSAVPLEQYPIGRVPFWSDLHAYSQAGHTSRFGGLAMGGL